MKKIVSLRIEIIEKRAVGKSHLFYTLLKVPPKIIWQLLIKNPAALIES